MEDTSKKEPLLEAYIANTDDMVNMFSDIDRLKDGNFAGKWQTFPTTKEEMQAMLSEIGVDSIEHPQYFVSGYDSYSDNLNKWLSGGADIDEINYLAVKLNEMDDFNREVFDAVMYAGTDFSNMTAIIQAAENIEAYALQPAMSAKDYGEFLSGVDSESHDEVFQRLEQSDSPADRAFLAYIERLERHVDTASYGREAQQEEKGVFTECGYLTQHGELTSTYKGMEDIPEEYRVFAYPGCMGEQQAELATSPENEPTEKPPSVLGRIASALDRLAVAKEETAKGGADKPENVTKSNEHEL